MSDQWNEGTVRRFPRLALRLQDEDIESVEFIVDTGFEGEISLPRNVADLFGRETDGDRTFVLANGDLVVCPYYEVDLFWDDDVRQVVALVLDGNPLLGIELLEGYRLTIDVRENGSVYVEPL